MNVPILASLYQHAAISWITSRLPFGSARVEHERTVATGDCLGGITPKDNRVSFGLQIGYPLRFDWRVRPDLGVDFFSFLVRQPLEWFVMTAKERVAAFLAPHQPRGFCDECLARALGIDPSTACRATLKTVRAGSFIREYGVCSDCGVSRLITRASR